MRVALIRGSLLRPWELPNYLIPGIETHAFASRAVAAGMGGEAANIHGLRSTGDLITPLGPKGIALADLVIGSAEYLVGLERALRGFDVAHALEIVSPLTLQALKAREAGAVHAVVATVMENIPYGRMQNRFVAERARRTAAGVDLFLAVTERAALHLRTAGVGDERIEVLPLGIDLDRFTPRETQRADGPMRVVSVARLEVAKGVEDLVIAAGLLARRGIDIEVTFAGQGPLHDRLLELAREEGVADRVTLGGNTPWTELERVYQQHDAFVLASAPTRNWREQFGFAIVEAMGCGLPVLAGGSGSLPEVVADEDSIVRPHDPLDLARALERLATDPEERRRQGERNRAWALERYDQRKVRERLREAYARVLERTARTP